MMGDRSVIGDRSVNRIEWKLRRPGPRAGGVVLSPDSPLGSDIRSTVDRSA